MLLAVDPGVRGCGCALFENGLLVRAGYVVGAKEGDRAAAWVPMVWEVAAWVSQKHDPKKISDAAIELPQVYQGSKQKGDPNDLIELAAVVGALCATLPTGSGTKIYKPREWKQQIPKEIHHERAMKRLAPSEVTVIELPRAKSLHHNVIDGVALGLTHLRRM